MKIYYFEYYDPSEDIPDQRVYYPTRQQATKGLEASKVEAKSFQKFDDDTIHKVEFTSSEQLAAFLNEQ